MKRSILLILILLIFLPSLVEAKKEAAPPAPPPIPAEQQKAFSEKYYEAMDAGPKAFQQFQADITGKAGEQGNLENRMMQNMNDGKAPDGSEAKGFRGDPEDSGPTNLANWEVQTDKDGNVTGFKEKDFEAKDTDKDGKISDAEREAWDKEKKKKDDEAGGPPGNNWVNPDWDKNGDGKPDPGFNLDCYQCVMPTEPIKDDDDRCHGNEVGPCGPGVCPANQKCEEYAETDKNQSYMCHSCEHKDACEAHGHSSDPNCGGQCKEGPCVAVDMDKDSGALVPTGQTRARGSTIKCYTCMKITEIEVTYVIVIIETEYGRVVLNNMLSGLNPTDMLGFSPQKVMAMATANNPNVANMQKLAALAGGKMSIMSAPQVAGMLSDMLKKKGKNGDDCFNNMPPSPSGLGAAPSFGSAEKSKDKKKNKNAPEENKPAAFGEDERETLAIDGPVVACGMKDDKPALAIFDPHGGNAELIDKVKLAANPDAILKGVQKAQGFYQRISAIIQNPVQALTQEGMSMLSEKVLERRPSEAKQGKQPKKPNDPNDPLYFDKIGADKKAWAPKVVFGGGTSVLEQMAGGAIKDESRDITDQWGLRAIGFTPKSDKNSAWNLVSAAEPNVTVAVIDSGVDMTHPDGPKYIWTNAKEIPGNGIDDDANGYVDDVHGWNFLDDAPDGFDYKGHGTAVAGIIAAQSNNGIGIAGINPGAVIMPLKVADKDGHTNSLAIYRAINYAVDNGAKVINISLGGRGVSLLEQTAIHEARRRGVFVTVASGNTGEYLGNVGPASATGAVSVGMVNIDGTRSPVSSWGPNNGLVAPGERIISLRSKESFRPKIDSIKHKEYFPQDGTSFAAPMVAGTASLMLAKNPNLTPADVQAILLGTAKDMDDPGWDEHSGAGMLDAAAALRASSAKDFVLVVVNRIAINRQNPDDKKSPLESVDVYGTVQGPFKDYVVGLGKGKNAGGFRKVSPIFTEPADGKWLAHIPADQIRGSDDWVVQIAANTQNGKPKIARAYFNLNK